MSAVAVHRHSSNEQLAVMQRIRPANLDSRLAADGSGSSSGSSSSGSSGSSSSGSSRVVG